MAIRHIPVGQQLIACYSILLLDTPTTADQANNLTQHLALLHSSVYDLREGLEAAAAMLRDENLRLLEDRAAMEAAQAILWEEALAAEVEMADTAKEEEGSKQSWEESSTALENAKLRANDAKKAIGNQRTLANQGVLINAAVTAGYRTF